MKSYFVNSSYINVANDSPILTEESHDAWNSIHSLISTYMFYLPMSIFIMKDFLSSGSQPVLHKSLEVHNDVIGGPQNLEEML